MTWLKGFLKVEGHCCDIEECRGVFAKQQRKL
jgi:hypothetical protein